ncbi:MAG TPA: phosphoribosylformylglycinamidine cyclo-ligase [Alphaproteobacteria bacterium]|nr:phosphoribosylformylglycinamidine cyclo-ligase [Alphaproteobacteria bacterium]
MQSQTSYRDAGVDVERGDAFVERIKSKVAGTYNNRVMAGVGGFAALYRAGNGKLLAAGTDGVGTKVKIAQQLGEHGSIGIDLVAMCVNDVICTGATPLFFLDYLATGKLDVDTGEKILDGIIDGCKQSECALIGGETAEMPGMYQNGEYDLAGFCVGEVMEQELIDGSRVAEGDTLIALPSSGFHSNGYSLVRKLVNEKETELLQACLTPTRIYWNAVKGLRDCLHGMAHITGGGFANIPRMNAGFDYVIDTLPELDHLPPVFGEIARRSQLPRAELYQTFNMGIGFVMATRQPDALLSRLSAAGERFWRIGHVARGAGRVIVTGKDGFTLD